ncbi:MAG: YceD family protein [bacterium]
MTDTSRTDITPHPDHSALPSLPFRVAAIAGRSATHVKFVPDVAARAVIAQALDLLDLPHLVFEGDIRSSGKRDLELTGVLKATAVQPCSVTLEPVKTKIEDPVRRLFLADYEVPTGEEVEIPEDDTIEPLEEVIDAAAVAIEALALALPLYPRAPGVELGAVVATPPDAEPIRDADLKPFANLAKLIQKGQKTEGKD